MCRDVRDNPFAVREMKLRRLNIYKECSTCFEVCQEQHYVPVLAWWGISVAESFVFWCFLFGFCSLGVPRTTHADLCLLVSTFWLTSPLLWQLFINCPIHSTLTMKVSSGLSTLTLLMAATAKNVEYKSAAMHMHFSYISLATANLCSSLRKT